MSGGSNAETGGYVTDVAYVAEFYADHAPTHINLIAAANGFRPRPLDQPFTWCDYGCGNGVTANVLAGCYPHAEFHGVDFLDKHVRTAEILAARGNLDNAKFLRKSFAKLVSDDLPPLDFAVMHGVLSWIDEPTRNAVLDDAARRLKPGGMLLTGTNAMPGWAAKLPMRNMVYSLTDDSTDSMTRAETGLKWLRKLKDAQIKYFRDNPAVAEAVDQLARLDLRYMAHEYFNQHLRAFYFAELKQMMEARSLKFAGSATLFLNMVDLAVPLELQDEFRAVKSRAELEAKRDFIRNEVFRRDVWVKGEPIKTEEEWLDIHQSLVFGTLEPDAQIERQVAFGDVKVDYTNEPMAGMLKAVAERGISIAGLENVPALAALSPWTRVDAARLLAAGGQVVAFARQTAPVTAPKGAKISMPAVNRGLIKELAMVAAKVPLAATHAGTGVELGNIDAVLLLAYCDKGGKAGDPDGAMRHAARLLSADSGDIVIGGKILKPGDVRTLLADRLSILTGPMLGKLAEIGVIAVEN